MIPPADTERFLNELEQYASRPIVHRKELGTLVELARTHGRMPQLEEAAFHAKFVVKSTGIMKRIGPGGEGFDKLQSEASVSAKTAAAALRTIVQHLPEGERANWERRFLALDQSTFDRLLELFEDLAWIKNWTLDGRALP